MFVFYGIAAVALLPSVTATPIQPAAVAVLAQPKITPSPSLWEPSKTYKARRGLESDLAAASSDVAAAASEAGNYIQTELSALGSDIPSYVASGVPNFFQDFPTGDKVQSSLGLDDNQVQALPTQVLNLPSYANWTDQGWNLRFRANVFKQPNITQDKLNDLANGFLIGTSISQLPPSQQDQARNLTAEIYVIQQENQNITFDLVPPQLASTPNLIPAAGRQTIKYPVPTTDQGDIDGFVQISNAGLTPGNATTKVQVFDEYTEGTMTGNASAYLVPTEGMTIISDIDDILRITQIYEPAQGLLNSFAKPFVPWMNMPEIYANWSTSLQELHFHYLTTTPEQITRNYMDFIYKTYPAGSFDTRPLNFSDVSATLSIRKFLLEKVFQSFPKRKFILVADTSNSDVMRDYPAMATEFPGQVQCIFLRNTSSTDSGDKFPYDTSGFKGLNTDSYMFFNVPDDLKGLNIEGGKCLNTSVKQNVTFKYQGLPFSSNSAAGRVGPTSSLELLGWAGLALAGSSLFGGVL